MRYYYAAQSPKGSRNEVNVHRFNLRASRDAWVSEHRSDGGVNSVTRGAYVLTAVSACRKLATVSMNVTTSLVDHDGLGERPI